jgi:hypothetical protein
VHLEHAGASDEWQHLAVFVEVSLGAIPAIGVLAVWPTSSPAPAAASTAATPAVVSVLAIVVAVSSTAATTATAAPTLPFLSHVSQNPYLNPLAKNNPSETYIESQSEPGRSPAASKLWRSGYSPKKSDANVESTFTRT